MISNLMQELAEYLAVEIVLHGEQEILPDFPYGEYRIIETKFEKPYQRIRQQSDAGSDNVNIKYYYDRLTVIRLTFYNSGESGDLQAPVMEYAEKSWMWLNEQGREICYQNDAVPRIISKKITAETAQVENINEYRVSFDFAIKMKVENASTIEAITGVDYEYEIKN